MILIRALEIDFAKLYESHKALRVIVIKQGESIKKLTEKALNFCSFQLSSLAINLKTYDKGLFHSYIGTRIFRYSWVFNWVFKVKRNIEILTGIFF